MLALVRRARRRLFGNELFAQGANVSSAALAAFILLLVIGTEILNWQYTLLIPAVAAAAGIFIARRRRPSLYRTAQIVDDRLKLADTLATALYFSDPEHAARVEPEIVQLQAETAERLAQSVDVRLATPFQAPRTAYAMAALLVVAGSLFALRYGISRRLDLKQPLATMLYQTFGAERTEQARAKQPRPPRPELAPDSDMASSEQLEQRVSDAQEGNADAPDDMTETIGKAESRQADSSAKKQEPGEQSASDQQDASDDDRAGNDGDSASSGQQGKQDSKQGNPKQDPNNTGDNNSLMSKVKDAVQNLLSRMKPQQNQSGGQQQSGEQQGQQGKGQQNGKQQSAKNGQQQSGSEQAEAQDGQAGEQAQNSQDQQGKGTGNSDAKQASKQPGSGIGSQDGDKRLKDAEQLAAMGKISEIIGKRAQTISGETTVEVQQTSQQLRTQYTSRTSQHSQGGAEISRDEIPVALQSYVEHYFEQVRKQAAAPAAPAKK